MVTYRYYIGRVNMFEDQHELAEKNLDFAFDHCHRNSVHNKKMYFAILGSHQVISRTTTDTVFAGKIWFDGIHTLGRRNTQRGSKNISRWSRQISGSFHSSRYLSLVRKMQNGRVPQFVQTGTQDTRQNTNFSQICCNSIQMAGVANGFG